ncbi:YbaB/EbfC family nucleoid-associated protein [Nocardia sp. NPDC005366]|uniref:YbaB/EbfC family nucleoid-associated protein n=1 Tax=Nocardia sp. NPDC005366 TaxID=3156878 RepID=UPI0033AFBF14
MTGSNDRLRIEVAQVLDDVAQIVTGLADAQRGHRRLTASGSAENGRIVVIADASGAVAEVVFGDGVENLGYHRIATATVRAAQQAANAAKDKSDELLTPLRTALARLPKLSDFLDARTPDRAAVSDEIPPPPPALLTPPRERVPAFGDDVAGPLDAPPPSEVPVEPGPDAPGSGDGDPTAEIIRLQSRRAGLYTTGAARGRRVMVAVNADGVMIDLEFSPAIGDLDYDEIADAITAASHAAVREVARMVTALFTPITGERPRYPGASATLADLGRFRDQLR